jgi:signal transduction histidine kinase
VRPAWEDAVVPYRAIADPAQLRALLGTVVRIHEAVEVSAVLRRAAEGARSLTDARYAAAGLVDPTGQVLGAFETSGVDSATAELIGRHPTGAGLLGAVLRDPRPLRLADLRTDSRAVGFPAGHPPMRSLLAVPLTLDDEVRGALYAADKLGGGEFTADDEHLLEALAATSGGAIEHTRLLEQVHELGLVADRERIARDLHDTVIQRLFAVGLELQSVLPMTSGEVGRTVDAAVDELDDIIHEVRAAIFALEPAPHRPVSLRGRVHEVCVEARPALGFAPGLTVTGPLDEVVSGGVAAELLATVREALANVAHHAGVTRCTVTVAAGDDLLVRVVDDGTGLDRSTRRAPGHGLADMTARAEVLGGSLSTETAPGGGVALTWRVPLAPVAR